MVDGRPVNLGLWYAPPHVTSTSHHVVALRLWWCSPANEHHQGHGGAGGLRPAAAAELPADGRVRSVLLDRQPDLAGERQEQVDLRDFVRVLLITTTLLS